MKTLFVSVLLFFLAAMCVALADKTSGDPPKEIEVELTVPDPAWEVKIERIYQMEDHLAVVSRVSRDPTVIAAQVITQTKDTVRLSLPDLSVKHYILGKTWGWEQEPYEYLEDEDELKPLKRDGKLLYEAGDS